MTFAQNCDMMEKTGRTRQGLPARFAIGYSQFYRQGPCFEAGRQALPVFFAVFVRQVGTFTVL